jgi:hypothetical protein
VIEDKICMRAISFADGPMRRAEDKYKAAELGQQLAAELK